MATDNDSSDQTVDEILFPLEFQAMIPILAPRERKPIEEGMSDYAMKFNPPTFRPAIRQFRR